MDRITDYGHLKGRIVDWIKSYAEKNGIRSLVIGVSGGIDSAVASTLSAETGLPVFALGMPILQNNEQKSLSSNHLDWLVNNYANVVAHEIELTAVFQSFSDTLRQHDFGSNNLALANSRSRLRMVTLYQVAGSTGGIVVGTGNKVEDYGVGFYTKYGDGGVDISPIADCLKTEIWDMGKELGINQEIIDAPPTDGLWTDGRTDEQQVGLSYEEIEEAMLNEKSINRQKYLSIRKNNTHKMNPIPVCLLPK